MIPLMLPFRKQDVVAVAVVRGAWGVFRDLWRFERLAHAIHTPGQ